MCYDYKFSIIVWLVVSGTSIYILLNLVIYYNWIPLFILTYSQIQVSEAILWSSLDNKDVNGYVTAIIPYLLLMQPLVNSYVGYKNTNEIILYYMAVMYTFLILYYALLTKHSKYETTIGKNNGLEWNRYENGKEVMLLGNWIIAILYLLGLF